MFKNKTLLAFVSAFILLATLLVGVVVPTASHPNYALAAPMAAPTPVAGVIATSGTRNVEWMNKRKLTATTRVCKELPEYPLSDIQWVVDEGVANSMTMKLQYTIDGINFVDGATMVAASNTVDVAGLQQYPLFGLNTCTYVKLANTNTVTITVLGVAKK